MRREPLGAMTIMPGDPLEPGDSGPGDSGDAFGRIVEAAIRNGRLTAAEIRELRALVAAAFRLAPPAEDTPAADVDWRTPPDETVH